VSGTYLPAFILCIVCIALSCLTFWIAAPRKGITIKLKQQALSFHMDPDTQ
jgi:hypothetical protein